MALANPKQVISELKSGKASPVYYLYGDEPYKVEEFVEKAKEALFGTFCAAEGVANNTKKDVSFCIDRIDGTTQSGSHVLDAIQSIGLFGGGSGKRLVIVRHAHQLKGTEELAETLMKTPGKSPWGDSVLLLLADTLDGRKKFHQWLKKQGYALEFKSAKDAELFQWIDYMAAKFGAKVAPEAAQMLAVLCEGSLHRLAQETEKAWLYAGTTAKVITAEHVSAIAASQSTHQMVELVQAVLEGKRTRALLIADRVITATEDALGFVGFMTWALKPNSFGPASTKMLSATARTKVLKGLIELDSRIKSTGMEAHSLVDDFIINLTR